MIMFHICKGYYAQYYSQTLKIVSRLSCNSQQLFVPDIGCSSGCIVCIVS